MAQISIRIKNWGVINCSESNMKIVEDDEGELYSKIKTNAIDLTIPREFIKIERLG